MLKLFQEQLSRERNVSGRVQIQVWYHDERKELVVAVLAGDDLAPRDDTLGFGTLPEAYARLCLMPLTYVASNNYILQNYIIHYSDPTSIVCKPTWHPPAKTQSGMLISTSRACRATN